MKTAAKIAPKVLFEDAALLVVNKPAGLVVHPAPSHKGTTLVDWIREYLGPQAVTDFEEADRLGLVHRLDKDTSGVIVVTKTPEAKTEVGRQFHDREIEKQYVAFVQGVPPKRTGIINAPIGRSAKVPSRMAITGNGRPSETRFEVVESMKEVALVNLFPKTGRTHQLRVHCAAIGHPIVGDATYGASARWGRDYGIQRPLLHAHTIELSHPKTGKRVKFEAPWPTDMKKARTMFKKAFVVAACFALVRPAAHAVKPKRTAAASESSSESASPAAKPAAKPVTTPSSSALKKEVAAIKEQFKSMIEEFSALQDRVTTIQSNLDEMGGARRLRDLEKAISDLNSKAVSTSATSEETKTQSLDLARKLKAQQDALEQMRDQLDRLQRELIQTRAREESAPAPSNTTRNGAQ